jgi:MoxR-like ATPase
VSETLSNADAVSEALQGVGYIPRRSDILALLTAIHSDVHACGGSKTVLLEGPAGTGKSALPAAVAKIINAHFVVYQFHGWSDADELFVGVDVCAAVAGDAESVRQEGVLATVARLSQTGTVVLLLDEIDKAPERAEYLLLDWLETGRVPIQPGVHLQTDLNRVMTFITSNGQRDLSEATKRRAGRVVMNPLPVEQQEILIRTKTGLPKGFVRMIWKAARAIAESEKNHALSIQEGVRLASSCWQHAESAGDTKIYLSHWAARSSVGRQAISSGKFDRQINAAWGCLCAERKVMR